MAELQSGKDSLVRRVSQGQGDSRLAVLAFHKKNPQPYSSNQADLLQVPPASGSYRGGVSRYCVLSGKERIKGLNGLPRG